MWLRASHYAKCKLLWLHSMKWCYKIKFCLSNFPPTFEFSQEKMVGPNFMDEIDCGSFFDHIDDLLDFPVEDVDAAASAAALPAVSAAGNCNSLTSIWPHEPESFPGSDSVFSGNSASDLSAELSVPVSFQNATVLSTCVFCFFFHMNFMNCSLILSRPAVSVGHECPFWKVTSASLSLRLMWLHENLVLLVGNIVDSCHSFTNSGFE